MGERSGLFACFLELAKCNHSGLSFRTFFLLKKKKKKKPGLQFCFYGLSHEISFYFKSKTPAQRVRKLANLLRMAV